MYIVYEVTDTKNKNLFEIDGNLVKIYYTGVHKIKNRKTMDPWYKGSSTDSEYHQRIKKYGRENFPRRTIRTFDSGDGEKDKEEAYAYEKEYINEKYISREDTYNKSPGGPWNGSGRSVSNRKIRRCVKGTIIRKENLPLPYAHYVAGGAIVGFSEFRDSEVFLCSCIKCSIEKIWSPPHSSKTTPQFTFHISRTVIKPQPIFNRSNPMMDYCILPESVSYKDNLCHQCNKTQPSVKWADPYNRSYLMGYAEVAKTHFGKHYGWYIVQEIWKQKLTGDSDINVAENTVRLKFGIKKKRFADHGELIIKHMFGCTELYVLT